MPLTLMLPGLKMLMVYAAKEGIAVAAPAAAVSPPAAADRGSLCLTAPLVCVEHELPARRMPRAPSTAAPSRAPRRKERSEKPARAALLGIFIA